MQILHKKSTLYKVCNAKNLEIIVPFLLLGIQQNKMWPIISILGCTYKFSIHLIHNTPVKSAMIYEIHSMITATFDKGGSDT